MPNGELEQTQIIDALIEQIGDAVRGGRTPEDAAGRLATITDAVNVRRALEGYREITGRIRTMRVPGAMINDQLEPWYLGPVDTDKFWPLYSAYLRGEGWDPEAIEAVDVSSTKIVSLLSPPGAGTIRTRGLVLGYVQSGKTANFTAVIAKAADAGYRFFLVLSGISNALRNQTQRRLDRDLVLRSQDWIRLTDQVRDFHETTNVNAFLTDRQALTVLGVVKKNSARLRRLRDWLAGARPEVLQACPICIIDDEADQASPNAHPDPDERTRINDLLVELLGLLPKAAYIGYTATPFANLLIDPAPEDLYPSDFILSLPRDDEYFGPERIFGRAPLDWEEPDAVADGLDMIRTVLDSEVDQLKPGTAASRFDFVPQITQSIGEALRYFWMATAARYARGQATEHSSMLIHTTQYSVVHSNFRLPVLEYRDGLSVRLQTNEASLLDELRRQWEEELSRVPSATATSFDEISGFLSEVLERTEVKVENSVSADRIDYEADGNRPKVYVVIGGNVLSRGLTLEGLSVSVFVRVASAYDTLLQMGRWFGYRVGYADLPRIWMTDDLRGYLYDLATVEQEIRHEIERYENGHLSPLEFGVRIRTHPHLAITSRLKMQHAVASSMSFSGRIEQTLVFKHREREWLSANLEAGRQLISRLNAEGGQARHVRDRPHLIYHAVPVGAVLEFLEAYEIHEHHVHMPNNLLLDYIRAQNERGRIRTWNVGIVTRRTPRFGTLDFGFDNGLNLVNRSRFLRGDLQYADVKALMSENDVGVDLNISTDHLRSRSRSDLQNLRERLMPDRGLLLLYPISKDSTPLVENPVPQRRPLEANEHVLGMALVFPQADDRTPQGYVTVDLSEIAQDIADSDDLNDED